MPGCVESGGGGERGAVVFVRVGKNGCEEFARVGDVDEREKRILLPGYGEYENALGVLQDDERAGQALLAGCLGSCVRTDHLGLEPAGHVLHVEGRHVKRALDG